MSAYLAVDVENCRRQGHRFKVAGSDKTPLKRSLICETCSGDGKTTYAAYGKEHGSSGVWRRTPQTRDADESKPRQEGLDV